MQLYLTDARDGKQHNAEEETVVLEVHILYKVKADHHI